MNFPSAKSTMTKSEVLKVMIKNYKDKIKRKIC